VTIVAQTPRLHLCGWALPADLEEAHALWGDARVMEHVGVPHDRERTRRSLEAAIEAEARLGFCLWRLVRRADGVAIGCAGFLAYDGPGSQALRTHWLELGYHLRPEAWGQGFATEAARACVALAPSLGATHLVALAAHEASRRVLAKLGFRRDARFDDAPELQRFVLPLRDE
jgi:RimJ/RimL family protein N-acetyltransferase